MLGIVRRKVERRNWRTGRRVGVSSTDAIAEMSIATTMTIANEKALRDLEFDRLRTIVKRHASSSLGEEAVDGLVPLDDVAEIERAVAEVGEAIGVLESQGRFSLGAVRDLAPLLERAKENAYLGGEEFLVVLRTIEATLETRDRLIAEDGRPRLRALAERLTAGGATIGREIRRTIDERGEVREDASPELARLHAKRRTLDGRVESRLRTLIDRHPELISEPVVTRRRGRLVVPIRSGAVGAMEFIVHDRSATGQTLYAEPTGLVADNNALAEISDEIRDEVRRILRALSASFVAAEAAFLRDRAILAHLDGLFARAGYALAHRCAFPTLGRRIDLRNARHPLIAKESVVPVSLRLGVGSRMVVITGPNTGGKTVTLKTLGLLTLMTQAGIPIPASPDSELAVVARVRTDIGDEQSIEQNLSTFSAHMKNIVSLLADADDRTLVLLDELGAGTDPQEGAALGLAVIEALLESESLVGISTHLTPLKYFAIRHPEVKTAAMEFDVQTLSPTYRVIEGIPGRSNAFIIAQRLGFPEERIERARSFLSQGEIRAEDIIDELERERQAMRRHREASERDASAAADAKAEYEAKLTSFEEAKTGALSDRFRAFDTFLRDGQRRVERILSTLGDEAMQDKLRRELQEIVDLRRASDEKQRDAIRALQRETLSLEALEVGAPVHVRSVDTEGRILQIGAKGKITVDLDGVRLTTDVADLGVPRPKAKPSREPRPRHRVRRPRPSQVPMQLNVRGMTVNEALRDIETYVDRLMLADMRHASILHGKGTGALSDAVRAYLGSCSFIRAYGFAPPNRGGEGVTEFELAGDDE